MTKEELVAWRKQRGLTQGQMASLVGKSRQAVIAWERGRYAIPDGLYVQLMRAGPAEIEQREQRENRITAAAFPHLYRFSRDILRHVPTPTHPLQLARRGLLGWSGLSWLYANVSDCSKPRADILDTDAYAAALEDLEANRVHPGVDAVRRWFTDGSVAPGLEITAGSPWPTLRLNAAVQPWEGFNNPYAVPPMPADAGEPWAIVRPPLPAGYFWSPSNQMVFLEEIE